MRVWLLLCCAVLVLCVGCKGSSEPPWLAGAPSSSSQGVAQANLAQFGLAVREAEERGDPAPDGKRPRKLVYHAEVDMMVEELTAAEPALEELLEKHGGVVANSETLSRSGAPRASVLRLRIPVARFDDFLAKLRDLGETRRSKLDVQDVTRSHSELEEQIRNLNAELAGLRDLAKKPTDKLADNLAVREQLSKVTREKAGLEARLQRMRARAEYSTVTLRLAERSRGAATALGTAATRAFWDSWAALLGAGRGAVLGCVMALPWLPLAAVVGLPLWGWWRRRRAVASA